MMMALAGDARSAVRAGARRRDAAAGAGEDAGKIQSHRRPLCAWRSFAGRSGGAGLPRLRFARRRLPVPRHGGHVASRRRSAGLVAAALGLAPSGQPIWLDMARRSATALHGAGKARHQDRATFSPTPRSAMRWSFTRPSAARPICCLHIPAIAHAAGCAGRPSTIGTKSTAACRALSMRCRTARSAIPPCASFWPAACRK